MLSLKHNYHISNTTDLKISGIY